MMRTNILCTEPRYRPAAHTPYGHYAAKITNYGSGGNRTIGQRATRESGVNERRGAIWSNAGILDYNVLAISGESDRRNLSREFFCIARGNVRGFSAATRPELDRTAKSAFLMRAKGILPAWREAKLIFVSRYSWRYGVYL
ncbi:uncharacterized protein LOC116846324 [Odontomachus brunneus]|uniref:uncharacterized protein LOC116846324 n=1 Tax=Odontomachus brunneus TaxID=486640 RepID=UPI0013F2169C|nr:uncharacterized protein LOC116846324 [Odontomachus brunneus]